MGLPTDARRQLNVRFSEGEISEVKEAAEFYGQTASDFIRCAVGQYLQTWRSSRDKPALPGPVEGKMRLADLARWDAERAQRATEPSKPAKRRRS